MKAVLLAAILVAIGVPCASAGTCEAAPKERRDNEKKYRARVVTGDKAFRAGKYEKARAEYRASLVYQDQEGAAHGQGQAAETSHGWGASPRSSNWDDPMLRRPRAKRMYRMM